MIMHQLIMKKQLIMFHIWSSMPGPELLQPTALLLLPSMLINIKSTHILLIMF
jgi:hypothetical protein